MVPLHSIFENVTQEKSLTLATAYSRRSPPSSFSNLTRTLILWDGYFQLSNLDNLPIGRKVRDKTEYPTESSMFFTIAN